jgi:SAM-dependent methyltransferase
LQDFKRKDSVKRVIGVDVDKAVLQNARMDETHVFGKDGSLPLEAESVDLIVSYAVFEHLEFPEHSIKELNRILKPGGWICAWTPNKLGYVAVGGSLIPNGLHVRVLRWLGMVGNKKGQRDSHDVFPTFYKINTLNAVKKYFPSNHFNDCSYVFSGPEGYAGRSVLLARLLKFYNWVLPSNFGTHLYVFVQKKGN